MPDAEQLSALITAQRGIVSMSQLRALGLTRQAVRRREARGWRFVLPGVLCVGPGELTQGQRLVAAQLFAGRHAVLASRTAAAWHGVLSAVHPAVYVLVQADRDPGSAGFVIVRRTTRPDPKPWSRGPLAISSRPRAVVDAARDAESVDQARAMVIEAVQRGLARVTDLRHELESGPIRGSRWARLAIQDAEAGAWSVPEGTLLRVLGGSRLLPVVWPNPILETASGLALPTPDGWIDDVSLAIQVHSRRHHLIGRDWEDTVMRDGVFAEYGIAVVAVTPSRIDRDPTGVLRLVERAYLAARGRPRPEVVMYPRGHGLVS